MSLYSQLAALPLQIDDCVYEPLEEAVSAGWSRHTTVIRLRGGGHEGVGEDVTYEADEQLAFQALGPVHPLAGSYDFDGFSRHLDAFDMFPTQPGNYGSRLYRRWAFESAALDLALRQAGTTLHAALGREPRPLTFVVSLGLGDPPTLAPIESRRALYPNLRFKLDPNAAWDEALIEGLAALECVDTLDLKGQYTGPYAGTPADPAFYRRMVERFPTAWIEDPKLTAETRPILEPHRDRVTWDAPFHALADAIHLPFPPRCLNIKPSRFGFVSELLRTYEYCERRGIAMYGGGQFELGPGRGQIQYLASLFHPDTPNDVAPRAFNAAELAADLPTSPLPTAADALGFRWKTR